MGRSLRGSKISGLLWLGDSSDLLHQAEGVIVDPLFLDFAPGGKPVDEDAGYGHPIAARRVAHELALVGAASRPANDHPIPFGYQVLDRNPEIGKGGTVEGHELLERVHSTHLSLNGGRTVADDVGGKNSSAASMFPLSQISSK